MRQLLIIAALLACLGGKGQSKLPIIGHGDAVDWIAVLLKRDTVLENRIESLQKQLDSLEKRIYALAHPTDSLSDFDWNTYRTYYWGRGKASQPTFIPVNIPHNINH